MRWHILNSTKPQTLDELQAVLLANRGLQDVEGFLHPQHPQELTPKAVGFDLKQLKKAVKRILEAKKTQELVVVFGDYDADGVSATAIMWKALRSMGLNVKPFIPERNKHGYGLSQLALDDLLAGDKPSLIITVDNGIVAHGPAQRVMDEDIDLIISDHHQPETVDREVVYPPAFAIVHSMQLCGTTVSWMLARKVLVAAGEVIPKNWELDLAAIATIADQVPLQGANRSFAYHGLEALRISQRVGLQALLKQSDIDQSTLTSQAIGFAIAPRINAMGRLGNSLNALRLLLTTNPARAEELAHTLGETNTRRQDLTYELVADALQQAKHWENEHIIIVHSESYHEGVIGLIAGRLMEQFYKPAIALSVSDKLAKASARSIAGVNIVELIRLVQSDLLEVGGHPMAAGFGLLPEKLEMVIGKLQKHAKELISAEQLIPKVTVDAIISTQLITEPMVEMIEQFAPFGQGNPQPILGFKQLEVVQIQTMGKDNQHLKIVARDKDDVQPMYFLAWRKGELAKTLKPGDTVDIAGKLEINRWKNKVTVQVVVSDVNGGSSSSAG